MLGRSCLGPRHANGHRFRFDTVQNEPAFDHDGADAFAKFRAEPPLMRKLRKGIGPFYDTLRNSVGARGTVLRDVAPNLVQILLRLSTEADLQILFPRGPTTASFSLEKRRYRADQRSRSPRLSPTPHGAKRSPPH